MKPLKISLVSEHASPLAVLGGVDAGGQNVHVAALAGELAARGHQVTVHTRRDAPHLASRVRLCPGAYVDHVPAGPPATLPKDQLLPWMEDFGTHLAKQWAADPPDLVHAHFWMSGLAALRAAAALPVPVLQTFHALGSVKKRYQGDADTSDPSRIATETHIARSVARVVATCRDEVSELAALGVPRSRVAVVPCGVDAERFTPRGHATARPGRPRLLQVGRLVPRKGAATSVAALARIPGAELVIAGGPPPARLDRDPEVRRLRSLAERSGVADRVRLLGGVPPDLMPALLRSADLVLCPPDYEPFGIVPLEAMSCGVPVVASAVGGHLDTVVDGVTGRLVPPGDPAALAAAVLALLAAPDVRRAQGAAGRARVLAHFRWSSVAAATEAVYQEVLAEARTPATLTGGL
ncbi:glycosyltransferase [Streptacidiphilus griseoplanus]|uniref:glycosyltransferase n=1 Tax=Peterkaempfera griseoplana TaxID=66896 RepID=UPI000AE8C150|nr:glycosyltransferase [Peterkaempfera griseoplana]